MYSMLLLPIEQQTLMGLLDLDKNKKNAPFFVMQYTYMKADSFWYICPIKVHDVYPIHVRLT